MSWECNAALRFYQCCISVFNPTSVHCSMLGLHSQSVKHSHVHHHYISLGRIGITLSIALGAYTKVFVYQNYVHCYGQDNFAARYISTWTDCIFSITNNIGILV